MFCFFFQLLFSDITDNNMDFDFDSDIKPPPFCQLDDQHDAERDLLVAGLVCLAVNSGWEEMSETKVQSNQLQEACAVAIKH